MYSNQLRGFQLSASGFPHLTSIDRNYESQGWGFIGPCYLNEKLDAFFKMGFGPRKPCKLEPK